MDNFQARDGNGTLFTKATKELTGAAHADKVLVVDQAGAEVDFATVEKQDALIALLAVPSTFNTGQKAVAITGTAVRLSASSVALKNGVTLQASPNNAAAVVIGGSGVANTVDGTGNGKVLQPGQAWAFAVDNLNLLYVTGTAGDWVDWSAN